MADALRRFEKIARDAASGDLHRELADSHPALRRGLVCCSSCSRERRVDSAHCLRSGWPECCGSTMTLLSAEAPDA